MLISRRGLLTGLASFVAAPAIVRASSLMPVKAFKTNEQIVAEAYARLGELHRSREAWYKVWHETAELLISPPIIPGQSRADLRACYSRQLDDMARRGLAPPFGWAPSA